MWRFKPIEKPTIWGGGNIAAYKAGAKGWPAADAPLCRHIGESLELSSMAGCMSVVDGGPDSGLTLAELIDLHGARIMGRSLYARFGNNFPIMVKLLDASDDLSVQVHPDDCMAAKRKLPHGKNEMWYIVGAAPGARLCAGFTRELSPEDYMDLVKEGRITEALDYTLVHEGDAYYIPAGTVHALGRGCLAVEIQQTSDVTYRIFDFNRQDAQGNMRELHTHLAMEALCFGTKGEGRINYSDQPGMITELLATPAFSVNRLRITSPYKRDYSATDYFKIIVLAQGAAALSDGSGSIDAAQGTVCLVGADSLWLSVEPAGECVLIETYVDPGLLLNKENNIL